MNKKITSSILVLVFGPLGMFYWSFLTGIASFIGMSIFILIPTFLGQSITIFYHILIRVVFLSINWKILHMSAEEQQTFRSMTWAGFISLTMMVTWNFIFLGGVGFIIWSLLT